MTKHMDGKWAVLIVILIVVFAWSLVILSDNKTGKDGRVVPFTVTINNVSDSQPLAPGVYAVHNSEFSMNFEGETSPEAFEPMAEWGAHTELRDWTMQQNGVLNVYTIDQPILPGESTTITIMAPSSGDVFFSGVQMAVASNDGYALVDSVQLFDRYGHPMSKNVMAGNYDNGTEQNAALGSGFAGGQPDPSRGEENIENGRATDPQQPVSKHRQLTSTILEASIVSAK